MSERLTEHNETGYVLKLDNPRNEIEARQQLMQKFKLACTKLGQLEDLFEKFDIDKIKQNANEIFNNIIVTKFKIGQKVSFIIEDIEIGRIEKITTTICKNNDENSIFYSITDKYGYALRLPEEQICLTYKEALEKLKRR